jgi:flagellar protein FlaG
MVVRTPTERADTPAPQPAVTAGSATRSAASSQKVRVLAESPPPAVVLRQVAERLEQYLRDSGRNLEFRVDQSTNATVVTVRRADTGEVVRQIPSEQALAVLRRLSEHSGTLLDQMA